MNMDCVNNMLVYKYYGLDPKLLSNHAWGTYIHMIFPLIFPPHVALRVTNTGLENYWKF